MLSLIVNLVLILLAVYAIYKILQKQKRDRSMLHRDKTREEVEAEQEVTREKAKSWRGPPWGGGGDGM